MPAACFGGAGYCIYPYFFSFFSENMYEISDTEILYSVNKTLQTSPDSSQRDFSRATHISLGMTNTILKRFAQKGWIMMKKVTPRKIQYMLTPAGINELTTRSRKYMARTFSDIQTYTRSIETFILLQKQKGTDSLVLYGKSDIAFLFEYTCAKYGISFIMKDTFEEKQTGSHSLLVYSEQIDISAAQTLKARGAVSVFEIAEKQ